MPTPRVVVLGSGFAGLEVVFRLRAELGAGVRLVMVTDYPHFQFKPNSIRLPFGDAHGRDHLVRGPLVDALRDRDVELRVGAVSGLDAAAGVVLTDHGDRLAYDRLVIATGAGVRPDDVPGLAEHARQIWSPGQMLELGRDLRLMARRASRSRRQRVLFAVPPGNLCSSPLYDMAFLLDTWLRRRHVRDAVEIAFTTYEKTYLSQANQLVHEMTADQFGSRHIDATAGTELIKVGEHEAMYADGDIRPFDLLITFPAQVAAVEYAGLPADDRGFLCCEAQSRAVIGHPEIHAPGDAGDHPVKQAYLATLQGTAAALDIVADLRGADLRGADLRGAADLPGRQMSRQLRLADDGMW